MKDFVARLQQGPAFLFLGQGHLRLESKHDALLNLLARKYSLPVSDINNYNDLLDKNLAIEPDVTAAWIYQRCLHLPIPTPLATIAEFAWSGVATSAFDDVIARAFRTEWRQIQSVLDPAYRTLDPRGRMRLHLWYLFGAVTAPEAIDKPPFRTPDLWRRKAKAVTMANKIAELVTPLGTLVIEGYLGDEDWFKPEALYAVVEALNSGQAYLFSATNSLLRSPEIAALIQEGKLIPCETSLAQVISEANVHGQLSLNKPSAEMELGRTIQFANKSHEVPSNIWSEIISAACLLPDSTFLPLSVLSPDQEYAEFRQFLFEAGHSSPSQIYGRGFAFVRDYEVKIRSEVNKLIRSLSGRQTPLLLHGQTGTGKTVALSHIAYDIQHEGRYPVLFIQRSMARIRRQAIDHFCEWAEEQGAQATLIVWDGMNSPQDYLEFLSYLQGRGRQVLLVGSTYRITPNQEIATLLIEASSKLSYVEEKRFLEFIERFDPQLGTYLARRGSMQSESFLVFLYRLLPPSRASIREGLELELAHTEATILQLASERTLVNTDTIMAQMLRQAGYSLPAPEISGETREVAGEAVQDVQELIGLVMVPGQFNLMCPLDLLLRAMGKYHLQDLAAVLKSVDLFNWFEDPVTGDLLVGPRAALEAELVVQQRLGGPSYEVDYAIHLLEGVRMDSLMDDQELQFAVSLVQRMGPNGDRPQYRPYYPDIARCLEKLRLQSGISNPRIMLQESMFFREAAKDSELDIEIKEKLLHKSEVVSLEATKAAGEKFSTRPLRSRILVELASTYGQMANMSSDNAIKLGYAIQAHETCFAAHSLDSQNFYPIDVIAWTVRDLLRQDGIGTEERLRLAETVINAFNLADAEGYTGSSLHHLNQRKLEIFHELGQIELEDQAFKDLIDQGSALGIYLRAVKSVEFLFDDKLITDAQKAKCKATLDYISQYEAIVARDPRSVLLTLRIWWAWKTGLPLHPPERTSVSLSSHDWQEFRVLLDRIMANEDFAKNLRLQYLKMVACFHLHDFARGVQLFRELEVESQVYRRRLFKYFLWSQPSGEPKVFSGTVTHVNEKGSGEIHVTEIQRRIPFEVRDTHREEVRVGDELSGFHIAFSMRGPIADFRD